MSQGPYFINEGSIQLPDGFHDRSTNIFVQGEPGKSTLNFNIARDYVLPGEDLRHYVTRQIETMQTKLKAYRLKARYAAQLGTAPVIPGEQIDATQRNNNQLFYQRQAAFLFADGHVLVFSATSISAPSDAFDALWRRWLGSFVPRPGM
jgi:prepilin-type processing-associated H-X9-DG protein